MSSLSLLVQGTKPHGLLVSSSSESLPPLGDGGRRFRTSLGDLLPSNRKERMGEGREPSLHRLLLVPVEVGWEGPRTLSLLLLSLSAQAQDKGKREGRRAAWLFPESFLQPPWGGSL